MDWLDNEIHKTFTEILTENPGEPLILFGASAFGLKVSRMLNQLNVNISYFCDNDTSKAGKSLNNIKIISTGELSNFGKDIKIGITSAWALDIKRQLIELGYKNVHILPNTDTRIQYFNRDVILDANDDINRLINILEDEQSISSFKNLINYRYSKNINYLEAAIDNVEKEYFDDDIVHLTGQEIFVDGGAYDGNTTLEFVQKVDNKFLKAYLFEPDTLNYSKLCENMGTKSGDNRFDVHRAALYSKNTVLNFSDSGDMGSRIFSGGKIEVNAVALDEAIDRATFIKLDVEGAEEEALLGSERIIKSHKPKLAVCIYHKPQDLWKLPLLIKKLNDSYKIYIRHYNPNLLGTVCYAV